MPGLGEKTVEEVLAALRTPHRRRARTMLEMWAAGLAAVDPERAVARALTQDPPRGQVTIVALGKAAPAMARGAVRVLGSQLAGGLIVTDHAESPLPGLDVLLGGHPDPDGSSLAAGRRLLEFVRHAENQLLFLVSGGGSALAELPVPGISIDDLVATRHALEEHGVAIEDMNTVRSHLSAIKGGRLAAAASVPFRTVVVSDVVGGGPHLVASGPTLPGSTTPEDARRVLKRYRLSTALPASVLRALSLSPPPPAISGGEVVVAADGARAARAAAAAGSGLLLTTTLSGPAGDAARSAIADTPPGMIGVLAGETTVEVTGSGTGGRNQEAALAAALFYRGSEIMFMAAGTDGIDGPTDAAGALIDGATQARIEQAGIDPTAALADNDSHPALDAAGALIRTGPTGTNVADLWIVDRT